MVKLLIFDLDDTLYNEQDYVFSGFRAVADFLFLKNNLSKEKVFGFLRESFLKNGRGKNFDDLIDKFSITGLTPKDLVNIYRQHVPKINLYPEAKLVLQNIKLRYKMCLLSNGWAEVQKLKSEALGLEIYFDSFFYAQENGLEFRKPHEKYFLKILSHYKIQPKETLMIGDDMECDINGADAVGIKTFLIKEPSDFLSLQNHLRNELPG